MARKDKAQGRFVADHRNYGSEEKPTHFIHDTVNHVSAAFNSATDLTWLAEAFNRRASRQEDHGHYDARLGWVQPRPSNDIDPRLYHWEKVAKTKRFDYDDLAVEGKLTEYEESEEPAEAGGEAVA